MDRADRGQGNAQRYINSFKWSATAETPQSCKAITKESFGCAPEIWQDNSVIEDDDAPLDAFDRELLAQANVQARFSTGDAAVPDLFYDESSVSASATPLSATKSPYFNPPQDKAQVTPVWSLAQSSSETAGLPSSPLVVAGKGRRSLFQNSPRGLKKPMGTPMLTSDPFCSPLNTASANDNLHSHRMKDFKPETASTQRFHGIKLVSIKQLPDRLRSIFPFPVFNAMQSKTYPKVYEDDCNLVLSSPTGSGKTVIMELAICRLLASSTYTNFKVVYQAPTKSLCSERLRDWKKKFEPLNLKCAELTGDTDQSRIHYIQTANIIITTPEKWDSMTRKWKDHSNFIQSLKLFLIDEVHILKETRGATLEAVVSRMKSLDSEVRIVALSATVPNANDIAAWLGRDSSNHHLPAHLEMFGEEFRPVKLQKYVYGYQFNGNDFAFDKLCDTKLPEIIMKHCQQKPVIIFCSTRKFAIATCKSLVKAWNGTPRLRGLLSPPPQHISVQDRDLEVSVSAGIAFHHAGLSIQDRQSIEQGFLNGHIKVICCTSTLAVGINLPCHLVIVKNTMSWQDNGFRQYSDLEVIQMLGRAGRPQFDDSAVAVILTRKEKVPYYEKLVSGSEPLESCLHTNLIDHLNAEIGLGTITNIFSAVKWLKSTFFFVRLQKNPKYYNLKEGADVHDQERLLTDLCKNYIQQLQETKLVIVQERFRSTELGEIMARYYVKFKTMSLLLSLPPKADIQAIISTISRAEEFQEIRLKAGEKSFYKEINKNPAIRYPIKIDVGLPPHKISLLIQAELGAVDVPANDQFQKHKLTFQQDKVMVFAHANRLIRCIVDCFVSLGDAVTVRNALELARSIGAKVWDNSPLQMKQIEGIGPMAVRKLASGGINTIEALELADPHRIDMLLSKNSPFGSRLLAKVAAFPKLLVELSITKKDIRNGCTPRIFFKATIGFCNQKPVLYFHKQPVNLCFLAECSNGRLIEFKRMSAVKLSQWQDIHLVAEVFEPTEYLQCHIMCEEIAGTSRTAKISLDLAPSCFLINKTSRQSSKTKAANGDFSQGRPKTISQDFMISSDDLLDDKDFLAAVEDTGLNTAGACEVYKSESLPTSSRINLQNQQGHHSDMTDAERDPNGKYECNHKCKNKSMHFCCREGLAKPPKSSRLHSQDQGETVPHGDKKTSRQLSSTYSERTPKRVKHKLQVIDLSNDMDCFGDDAEMDSMFQSASSELEKGKSASNNDPAHFNVHTRTAKTGPAPTGAGVGLADCESDYHAEDTSSDNRPTMTAAYHSVPYSPINGNALKDCDQVSDSAAVPLEWEGIDPEIYEEFGDFVEIV